MNLYPHNQQAYEAVMHHFAEGNKKAAIVHATGTGKSYCIGAISNHFDKVIVIAPNNFVLNETRKVCREGTEFRTYASVMYDETPATDYDLIVLDEFHRSGAEKWGIGISNLLNANPNAKLLGTSATHIRYLDNARNMADELFDGNVVSHLLLREAIDRGILPNPTYVASIYSLSEDVAKRQQRIRDCKKSDEWKNDQIRHLDGLASNWDNADGVPRIIKKYFDHDMQRIIVFCSKVSKASQARKWLGRWFGYAGFKRIRFYNIDYKEQRLEQEMRDFQGPVEDGCIKVAISVNMLNEGVHIPRVDGIIMLRSTISRIIIEQQIGRCLTSDNKHRVPVVLDLVNNMDMIRYDLPEFAEGFMGGTVSGSASNSEGFPFKVIDECRDIRTFFSQLDQEIGVSTLMSNLEACKVFYAEHGRLPKYDEDHLLYNFIMEMRQPESYRSYPKYKQQVIAELVEMGFDIEMRTMRYNEMMERLKQYLTKHGYQPQGSKGEGCFLYGVIAKLRANGKRVGWTEEQVKSTLAYIDSFPTKAQIEFQKRYDFVAKVLPTIVWFSRDDKDNEEKKRCRQIINEAKKRDFTSWDEDMYAQFDKLVATNPCPDRADIPRNRVFNFVKENNRLPMSMSNKNVTLTQEQINERGAYVCFVNLYNKGDKSILALAEQYGYGREDFDAKYDECLAAIERGEVTAKSEWYNWIQARYHSAQKANNQYRIDKLEALRKLIMREPRVDRCKRIIHEMRATGFRPKWSAKRANCDANFSKQLINGCYQEIDDNLRAEFIDVFNASKEHTAQNSFHIHTVSPETLNHKTENI